MANIRRDFIEKSTTKVCRQFATIYLEDLNVKGMAQDRHNAKYLADASMGAVIARLKTKAERFGSTVVEIDRWFASSKRCSSCGHIHRQLSRSDRIFQCPRCQRELDRDLNAAINIHHFGLGKVPTVSTTGGQACEDWAEAVGFPRQLLVWEAGSGSGSDARPDQILI